MSNARFVFSPERIPQGLKPKSLVALSGTAKAEPFQIVCLPTTRTDNQRLLNCLAFHLRNFRFFVRDGLLVRSRTKDLFHADVFADVHHIRGSRGFLRTNFMLRRRIFGLLRFASDNRSWGILKVPVIKLSAMKRNSVV